MTHYSENIRNFNNVVEMNSSYDENAYKFIIKKFYDRINRNFNFFNEQIFMHNIRRYNILTMNDILLYVKFKFSTKVDKLNYLEINTISRNSIKLQNWP